tara:strand:+ start:97362 stop:97841 length:480 start_codon:yes stop_codon:yes gene_type:complete
MPIPKDDRDRPCAVARLTSRQLAWRSIGIKSLTKDELVKQEQQVTLNTEIGIALLGGVLGWILWTAVIMPFTSLQNTLLGHLLIPFVFSIVISTLIWFITLTWVRQRKFSKIAGIHLKHGHCAGCGYELRDLPTENDGCVVCPECNAAWNADRIGAEHA